MQLTEVTNRQAYTAELPMYQCTPAQYIAAVQAAAFRLDWLILRMDAHSMICQTDNDNYAIGDIITITVSPNQALLQSEPNNEYYNDETQSLKNIDLFKQTIASVIEEQVKAERSIHPMHREKYGALVPSKTYLVTPLIVYANALVFLVMVLAGLSPLNPTAQSLYQWGGNIRGAVINGDWWRLGSYMFLHSGFMHLFMNMFALLYIGMFLEPLLGKFRFAAAYVLTGICAGLMSIAMHSSSVGVGASGAIFGMYGVFLSVLTTSHIQKTMRKTMLRSMLFFVVFNLMSGLQGNIDNAAHIGGLLSGGLIGYAYYPGIARRSSFQKQMLVTGLIAISVIALTIAIMAYLKGWK